MYVYVRHTHPYNLSTPSCYSSTAVFNDCYSVLMPYTALANSYGVSVCDVPIPRPHPLMIMATVAI